MMRLRLACVLGVTAFFSLVQACSTAQTTPPSEKEPGEQTPGGDDDDGTKADEKKGEEETTVIPTPGPTPTPPPPAPPPPPPKSSMTFFVSSTPAGTNNNAPAANGNLGGLTGADATCTKLAAAAPIKGDDHTWAAYLSVQGTNAKDRIGAGPWQNQKGKVIATSVAELLKQDLALGPDTVDEKGAPVPDLGRYILTGSDSLGVARGATCNNWTSNAQNQQGGVGDGQYDTAKNPNLGASFSFAKTPANVQCNIPANGPKSQGRIYCFAKD